MAAFGEAVGQPPAVLSFLAAVSAASVLVRGWLRADEAAMPYPCYQATAYLLERLLNTPGGSSAYGPAVSASPATQQALLDLLLLHMLPGLAAHTARLAEEAQSLQPPQRLGWVKGLGTCASQVAYTVTSPALVQALITRIGQPGGAAHVQQAARLSLALLAIPLAEDAPERDLEALAAAHSVVAELLAALVAAGHGILSRNEWSSGSGVQALTISAPAGRQSGSADELRAAQAGILSWLPQALIGVRRLATVGCQSPHLLGLCSCAASTFHITAQSCPIDSWQHIGPCAAAADAALRALPAVLQLEQAGVPAPRAGLWHQPCSQLLLQKVWGTAVIPLFRWLEQAQKAGSPAGVQAIGQQAAVAEAAEQLYHLHMSSCRLLQWLAGSGPGSSAAALGNWPSEGAPAEQQWWLRLVALGYVLLPACQAARLATQGMDSLADRECWSRRVQAMAAAHWEAIQTVLPLCGSVLPRDVGGCCGSAAAGSREGIL
ncbi:hypothetical protein ABPG75_003881 [Micractinium tetrahymenae]